ncbi:MAG TPA: ABC transporter ATP-binding protein [Allosphingosinicella sp.]|jgi:ABC-type multidrug transport system fused ATPase/permease subunit
MSVARKRQFYGVLALMLFGAIAELAALGSVLPFLTLLADPDRALAVPVVGKLFAALGAETPKRLLIAASALFIFSAIMAAAVRVQLALKSNRFVHDVGHDVAVEIQRRILYQPYIYHVGQSTSDIIASLQKVAVFVFGFMLQIMAAATAAVIAAFIIALLFYIDWMVALSVGLMFSTIYGAVMLYSRKRLERYSFEMSDAYSKRVQIVQESLGGIRDIIVDKSQAMALADFRALDRRLSTALATVEFLGASPRFVIEAAGMVMIAVVALALSSQESGLASALPVLGALALGAQRLLPLLQQVYVAWSGVVARRGVALDIIGLLDLPLPPELPQSDARPLEFSDKITFQDVSFAYPARPDPVLQDVSIEIRCGSRVALIGSTGSGKSTLVDMLLGLLEPTSGAILVDGQRLAGADIARWQSNIAHVPQTIFLADTTVARNIALGAGDEEIDLDRVAEAAERAQLLDFVRSLPAGFETMVGERGVQLSGGQRQRLGIARALYKRARVLILDEATSALDNETEALVMRALDDLGPVTIVMIAHRLSTIASCEQVIRLEKGRVLQIGTYDELVRDGYAQPAAEAANS